MNTSAPASRPLRQSILGRIILLGVLPAAAAFVAVVAVGGFLSFTSLRDAQERVLLEACESSAMEIEAQNAALSSLARAFAAAKGSGLFGRREESMRLQRILLEGTPEAVAVSIGYEPDADGRDREWAGEARHAAVTDGRGRFIPYCKRDPGSPDGFAFEPLVGMEDPDNLWYQEPKRLFEREGRIETVFTAPYPYEGVDMVEQMHPIVVDGRFAGVVGIDRSLERIDAALLAAVARVVGDAFLMTRGKFISATTDAAIPRTRWAAERLQTAEVAASPYASLFARFERDPRRIFIEQAIDPVLGEACYYAVTRVPTGGWLLVVREPSRVLLAPVLASLAGNALVAAAGLAVLVGLLAAMARSMSRRVGTALAAVERIAEGNLACEACGSGDGGDELADLLRGLDRMADRLRGLVERVRDASVRLDTTAEEVSAGSRRQAETAVGFGASVNEIASASLEISTTGTELLRTMESVDAAAGDTASMAEEGRRDLSSIAASMQRLQVDASSVSSRLAAIDEKAASISGVVTTITRVADQTNLLSVNAALEAEKAGEFGVGFMVVAREIRRLADQTAEATLDIERMVSRMQEAVAAGVGEMKRLDGQVAAGAAEVLRVVRQIEAMIERVAQGSGEVGRVREGMASQSEGASQITQSLSNLGEGASSASASSEEFSRAAADLQQAVGTLREAIACFRIESS